MYLPPTSTYSPMCTAFLTKLHAHKISTYQGITHQSKDEPRKINPEISHLPQ